MLVLAFQTALCLVDEWNGRREGLVVSARVGIRGKKKGVSLWSDGGRQTSKRIPPANPILSLLVRSAISPSLPFVTDIPSSLTGQRQIDHPKRPSRGFSRNKQSSHIIIESANENFIHVHGRPIRHSKTRGLGRRCLNRIGKWYVHPPRWWARLKFESLARARKHAVSLQHIPNFPKMCGKWKPRTFKYRTSKT